MASSGHSIELQDVVITDLLADRSREPGNPAIQISVLRRLARIATSQPEIVLSALTEMAVEFCRAGSAGFSVLETSASGQEILRCVAVAGALKSYAGVSAPRHGNPCGACLDSGKPILFSRPARFFPDLNDVEVPITEVLAVPIIAGSRALGVIWVMSHDGDCRFTSGDVDVAESLGSFIVINQHLQFNRALMRSVAEGVCAIDRSGRIIFANPHAEELLGYREADLLGKKFNDIVHHLPTPEYNPPGVATSGLAIDNEEDIYTRQDGRMFPVSYISSPVQSGKETMGMVIVFRDITEHKKLEQQWTDAEKYRSLGVLAAGIAHDFNNLLTGVIGNASLALEMLPNDNPIYPLIQQIGDCGARAAVLTRQMLDYAGKGSFHLETVELSQFVQRFTGLIPEIPPSVNLVLDLAAGSLPVQADPAHLEHVLTTLVTNAAEAIGDNPKGVITIITGLEHLDAQFKDTLTAGDYAVLKVRDTGCGMDAGTLSRIFDPFFSTKFSGRGLGLAAAQGVVRRHRGAVFADSTQGSGSTFTVLLPLAA
jgi:PAS domain S-box-containing protein